MSLSVPVCPSLSLSIPVCLCRCVPVCPYLPIHPNKSRNLQFWSNPKPSSGISDKPKPQYGIPRGNNTIAIVKNTKKSKANLPKISLKFKLALNVILI